MRTRTLESGRYYGRQRRELASRGVRVVESIYPIGLRIPRHAHERAHFCFVIEGGYDERIGRGATMLRSPGSLMYYPPDTAHAEYHHAPGRHLLLEADMHDTAPCATGRLTEPVVFGDTPAARAARRVYREFLTPDAATPLVLEGLVLELMAALSGPARRGPAPEWLDDVRALLEAGFDSAMTLAEIGATVSVHPVHVARVFRRHHGCSVGEYVRRLRVQHACRRIAGSNDALAVIAAEAGFADQAHLSRLVRRLIGMSPSDLRS